MKIDPKRLKLFLLDSELVSKEDVESAEQEAKKSDKDLGGILVEKGKVSEDDLARLHAYILGVPFVNLEHEKIDKNILSLVPESVARNHNIVAYKKSGKELEVAMLDPQDLAAIDFIKKSAGLKIKPRLTSPQSIKHVLSQYQKSLEAEFDEIIRKESGEIKPISEDDLTDIAEKDLKKLAEDLPIVRIVDTLLKHAIVQRASDIHVEPAEKEVLIRYRIDGILRDAMVLPKQVATGIIARIKVLSSLKLDEHRLPQDGRFKIETDQEKVSFRVSIMPVFDGEKAVLRLLPENVKGFTLETLGFHGDGLEKVESAIRKPTGMILATGPTGSGKTTTLYTILEMLNKPGVNISTVEDPVEYRMPRINQTQVRPDIGLTFANGLRSLLRQDPDVIMVGEIRDNETAALAVNAALTGHLVLSTLHTNSAAGAMPRLLEMEVEPFLIASTVNLIIAQRLVRKLCKESEEYTIDEKIMDSFGKNFNWDKILETLRKEKIIKSDSNWPDIKFRKPKQSDDCPDGYKDRVGIHEVLEVSESIKRMIAGRSTADEIESQAKKEGMLTMFEDGAIDAAKGITSLEEVLRVSSE